jgi:hypothetical protein
VVAGITPSFGSRTPLIQKQNIPSTKEEFDHCETGSTSKANLKGFPKIT